MLAQVSPSPPQYTNAPSGSYLKTKRAVRALELLLVAVDAVDMVLTANLACVENAGLDHAVVGEGDQQRLQLPEQGGG